MFRYFCLHCVCQNLFLYCVTSVLVISKCRFGVQIVLDFWSKLLCSQSRLFHQPCKPFYLGLIPIYSPRQIWWRHFSVTQDLCVSVSNWIILKIRQITLLWKRENIIYFICYILFSLVLNIAVISTNCEWVSLFLESRF